MKLADLRMGHRVTPPGIFTPATPVVTDQAQDIAESVPCSVR
jgi:hypothetical protein